MRRLGLLALALALCVGCGAEEAVPTATPTPVPTPAETPGPELEDAALYRQLGLYIRRGLIDYGRPGVYTLSFGPVEATESSDDFCAVAVEGGDGIRSAGRYRVDWDEAADWYTFDCYDEPFLTGPGEDAYWYETAAEAAVWSLTVDTGVPEAEPQKFDTPPIPVETITEHQLGWIAGAVNAFYRTTYHYVDQRHHLELMQIYPRIVSGNEADERLNDALYRYAVEEQFFQESWDYRQECNGIVDSFCELTRDDERYLSMWFYNYEEFRQAPHPNNWMEGLTLDRRTGEKLELNDVLEWDGDDRTLLEEYDWAEVGGIDGGYKEVLEDERAYISGFYLTPDKLVLIVDYERYFVELEADLAVLPLRLKDLEG